LKPIHRLIVLSNTYQQSSRTAFNVFSPLKEDVEQESGGDPDRIVDRAFRLALGRPPLPDERKRPLAFLREQPLTEFALALFNLNGFLYVP